ncbi:MAG TPA: ABC transporter substrate-binding protein [Beijerinckiaceae bacterium]
MTHRLALRALAGAIALAALAAPARAEKVSMAIVNAVSDVGFFIADAKGYFKAEGIEPDFIAFDTGAKMVAPLGTGQLDVGGGAPSAGLYNAIDRGIKIRMVADKAHNKKGAPFQFLLVSKPLFDKGEVKSIADLKGRKVAITGQGGGDASVLNEAMKSVGLTFNDVEKVYLGFPQHAAALQNGAVAASITTEPTVSNIVKLGAAHVLTGNDAFYPDHQTAVILFSEDFATKKKALATKFMRAYIKASRDFNDAVVDGKIAGKGADEIIAILAKYSNVKDPALLRALTVHGVNPDGALNVESLKKDLAFFRAQGDVKGPVTVEQVVDTSFAEAAVKELGPYTPAK